MKTKSRWADALRSEPGLHKLTQVWILAFFLVSCFGLTQSPGFNHDESLIAAPALSLLRTGHLQIAAAGPDDDRENSYFYQTPLFPVALAGLFKLLGTGLWQGRFLSLLLAAATLIVLARALRPWGNLAGLMGVVLLSVDPVFVERGRLIRYDMPAMIGALAGFILLAGFFVRTPAANLHPPRQVRAFLAGLCLGLAVEAHFLYVLYVGAFGLLILIFSEAEAVGFKVRIGRAGLFTLGFLVAMIPFALYALAHPAGFRQQFLFQLSFHHGQSPKGMGLIQGEIAKYHDYYMWTPMWLAAVGVAFAFAAALLLKDRRQSQPAASAGAATLYRQVVFLAVLMPLLLAFTSGHWYWHHLMVAPVWAMLIAATAARAWREMRPRLWRPGVLLVFALAAAANGWLVNWGYRAYAAVGTWNTWYSPAVLEQIKALVPPGSRVYGDFRLIFLADQQHWDFTFYQVQFPQDAETLKKIPFDYLVFPAGLQPWPNYELVAEVKNLPSPLPLPQFNPTRGDMIMNMKIYVRKTSPPVPVPR